MATLTTQFASLTATGGIAALSRASSFHAPWSSLSSSSSLSNTRVFHIHPSTRTPNNKPAATSFRCEVRSEQKVRVVLGPYRDGALVASATTKQVSPDEVEKVLKAKLDKTYEIERINFTGSGAKLGHTVTLRFEGKYADGPNAGQPIKGTKSDNFELELKERSDEPWSTFVKEIVKKGMGQEETKSFEVKFPSDYKAKPLAGVKAFFNVTVKEIGIKKELPKDERPLDVQRAEIEAELKAALERETNETVDLQIRDQLLESSEADVEKVAASVTWAKFGEKSLKDFKWNVLQEEIARVEEITFEQVPGFLRGLATINYT